MRVFKDFWVISWQEKPYMGADHLPWGWRIAVYGEFADLDEIAMKHDLELLKIKESVCASSSDESHGAVRNVSMKKIRRWFFQNAPTDKC